jgi:ribosomal-protein-alanine N-acetyltransferase
MVEVDKNNFKAINLYQKLEFKLVSIRKNYYGHKRDALIMKLNKKCS